MLIGAVNFFMSTHLLHYIFHEQIFYMMSYNILVVFLFIEICCNRFYNMDFEGGIFFSFCRFFFLESQTTWWAEYRCRGWGRWWWWREGRRGTHRWSPCSRQSWTPNTAGFQVDNMFYKKISILRLMLCVLPFGLCHLSNDIFHKSPDHCDALQWQWLWILTCSLFDLVAVILLKYISFSWMML